MTDATGGVRRGSSTVVLMVPDSTRPQTSRTYLLRDDDLDIFLDSVPEVPGGQDSPLAASTLLHTIRAAQRESEVTRRRFAGLTAGEAEVLELLMEGKAAAVIAAERVVAVSTVRSQIRALLTKLGVGSQLEAVALAYRCSWSPGHVSHGGP